MDNDSGIHSLLRPETASAIPMVQPIPTPEGLAGSPAYTPNPFPSPFPNPIPSPFPEIPRNPWVPSIPEIPAIPKARICNIDLREGCYHISFKPRSHLWTTFSGTLRVERRFLYPFNYASTSNITLATLLAGGDQPTSDITARLATSSYGYYLARLATTVEIISGDLYRFPFGLWYLSKAKLAVRTLASFSPTGIQIESDQASDISATSLGEIPIFARNRYYSYLKVTGVETGPVLSPATSPCWLRLTMEEFRYTQPPAGEYSGSFPTDSSGEATPSRTITVVLNPSTPPAPFSGPYFEGKLYERGVDQGTFTMAWVSPYFRKATLEIDTVTGASAPQSVEIDGTTHSFESIFNQAGWDLNVLYDDTALEDNLTGGTGVWSRANLHALMETVRKDTTNLDKEWRAHLLCVPDVSGAWGIMYDSGTLDEPPHREGAATGSDERLPDTESYGSARNNLFKDAPGGVYLRSATHEVGHIFNLYHSSLTVYGEPGVDATIMTGTANIAADASLGQFPGSIDFRFNSHDRHHLIHFPDPFVRPGAMDFGEGHKTTAPEVDQDRTYFPQEELQLRMAANSERVKMGEPLRLEWTLSNRSKEAIITPDDIGVEAQHALISVLDPSRHERWMPAFVIQTNQVALRDLEPGASRTGSTWLFWSTRGFAFHSPGKHTIMLRIVWSHAGAALGVTASADVWVDYPTSDADNEVLSLLMHSEVGKFIALGGGARHLNEAVSRIEDAISRHPNHAASACMAEFEGHRHSKVALKRPQRRPRRVRGS